MLDSKMYILSKDFTKSKLDFDEANTLFLSAISPKTIKKDNCCSFQFMFFYKHTKYVQ